MYVLSTNRNGDGLACREAKVTVIENKKQSTDLTAVTGNTDPTSVV